MSDNNQAPNFGNPGGDFTGFEDSVPTAPSVPAPPADDRPSFVNWLNDSLKKYLNDVPEVGGTIVGNIGNMFTDQTVKDSTLGQSRYDFSRRVFPSDLGSAGSYHGHYMVININVQESSNMTGLGGEFNSTVLDNEYSKVDVLRFNLDRRFADSRFNANFNRDRMGTSGYTGAAQRPRFTKRIAESIAIYMPSAQLEFSDVHKFEEVSLTSFGASVARFITTSSFAGIGGFIGGVAGAIKGAETGNSIFDAAGRIVSNAAQLGGAPINPKVEVIYSNTAQRQFRFDFLMSPSNQQESESIEAIIKALRFHAAPELRLGAIASFFWIPPSEFDITFYNRGVENTKLPRINTCVLEQVDVSYAPSGAYSTFYNGYPVQVRMQLTFRETEVLHKKRITDGF